jgi:hypothetical protein
LSESKNPFLKFLGANSDFKLKTEILREKYDTKNTLKDIKQGQQLYVIGEPKPLIFHQPQKSVISKLNVDELLQAFKQNKKLNFTIASLQKTLEKIPEKQQDESLILYNLLLASYLKNLDQRVLRQQLLLKHEPMFAITLQKLNKSKTRADINTLELSIINSILLKDTQSCIKNMQIFSQSNLAQNSNLLNIVFGLYLIKNNLDGCMEVLKRILELGYVVEDVNLIHFLNRCFVENYPSQNLGLVLDQIMGKNTHFKDGELIQVAVLTGNKVVKEVEVVGKNRELVKVKVDYTETAIRIGKLMNEFLARKLDARDDHIAVLIYRFLLRYQIQVDALSMKVINERKKSKNAKF